MDALLQKRRTDPNHIRHSGEVRLHAKDNYFVYISTKEHVVSLHITLFVLSSANYTFPRETINISCCYF